MQIEGTVVNRRSTTCHGLNLVLDLNENVLKFLVFLSNNSLSFSLCFSTSVDVFFSLCFSTSVDAFLTLFNCSISMDFPCLWKTWFQLLKCLHASIA